MLFNSFEFLIFLPIVFLLYWFVLKPLKWQNLLVVVSSYVFYGWWDWRFLVLIAFTTLCSYFSGLLIEKKEDDPKISKCIALGNIILNLSILGVFKYYNFFGENLVLMLKPLGISLDWVTLNVVLPVGVSFYTFQSLSYTIDTYKRKIRPTHDIVAFFAFISFFPQLVAGPIERATNLLPQFLKSRSFDYASAVDGMRQILWGLFKKVVVADNCAVVVNQIFNEYQELDGYSLFLGAIYFAFQIYCDFSGYSDIAIGSARLFGISLMRNFAFPYFSRGIAEFWKRWHISLTSWFRDYVYLPLGGSRCTKWKVVRNTFVVFLVSGLWHGANWTFLCWGLFHAILFFVPVLAGKKKYDGMVANDRLLPSVKEFVQMCMTFLLVVLGWIIFRAESMGQALDYIVRIFNDFHIGMPKHGNAPLIYIFILTIVEWLNRDKQYGLQIEEKGLMRWAVVRWAVYYAIFMSVLLLAGKQQEFIYFQF